MGVDCLNYGALRIYYLNVKLYTINILNTFTIKDIEIPVFVTGYGQIFEGSVDKTACNTGILIYVIAKADKDFKIICLIYKEVFAI